MASRQRPFNAGVNCAGAGRRLDSESIAARAVLLRKARKPRVTAAGSICDGDARVSAIHSTTRTLASNQALTQPACKVTATSAEVQWGSWAGSRS